MKIYIYIVLTFFWGAFFVSCNDDFVNQSPESSLTEKDVFSKLENFKRFFETAYSGPNNLNIRNGFSLFMGGWDQKFQLDAMTDISDAGRLMPHSQIKSGNMGNYIDFFTHKYSSRPILEAMFKVIRISNISLERLHLIQDAKENDIYDLKGQAFFVIAFAHCTLFK